MMSITPDDILRALRHVHDPDLKKDLVSLGMVSDVEIAGNHVRFKVTLTTPACPLKEKIKQDCINAVRKHIPGIGDVEVVMDAQVTSARLASVNVLPSVKNIICVASGKGGVGKSTVSANLAVKLAAHGARVGLIDADIHGPSIPTMFGIKDRKPTVRLIKEKHYMEPVEAYGVKTLSLGFLINDHQPVVWRGPMVTSALRQFVTDCIWGKLDYLIIDMPPGTGDVHLTVAQIMNVTGAIIVTTPQDVALADARKALAMFRLDSIRIPVLGVVENMAYFTPDDLPDRKYYIFGSGGGKRLADEYEVPFLGEIPIVTEIRTGGDEGRPASLFSNNPAVRDAYEVLALRLAQQVAISNALLVTDDVAKTETIT
ncbi:MAG: Mrp/NBP35 family ATP-binding protein [Chitinophagales bacterium]|nr:Mrp/NBP35 family ATP-binding protein [Chitinophagales bacterium]MDW8418686.1 Mrp/NBP35 family ATP-binding protein [Chitinophagales bacterium]